MLSIEKRYVRPGGQVRWGWLTATTVAGPNGRTWTLAHIQDITDRRAAEQDLRDSESNLAAVAAVARRIRTGEPAREGILTAAREIAHAALAVILEIEDDELVLTAAADRSGLLGLRVPLTARSINAEVARTGKALFVADPRGTRWCPPSCWQPRAPGPC